MGPRQATAKKNNIRKQWLILGIKLLYTNQKTSENLGAVQVFFNVRRQSGIPIKKTIWNLRWLQYSKRRRLWNLSDSFGRSVFKVLSISGWFGNFSDRYFLGKYIRSRFGNGFSFGFPKRMQSTKESFPATLRCRRLICSHNRSVKVKNNKQVNNQSHCILISRLKFILECHFS